MTQAHLLPDELLLDYAVGSARPAHAFLVETHLAMSDGGRETYRMICDIGGALLDSIEGRALQRVSAESVLALDSQPAAVATRVAPPPSRQRTRARLFDGTILPGPLAAFRAHLEDPRAWRWLGFGVRSAILPMSEPRSRIQVLKARRGLSILEHTHLGDETVLLLRGAFWIGGEKYGAGDIAHAETGTVHTPVIDDADDCYCLALNDGPIRFTGRRAWLLNQLNRF